MALKLSSTTIVAVVDLGMRRIVPSSAITVADSIDIMEKNIPDGPVVVTPTSDVVNVGVGMVCVPFEDLLICTSLSWVAMLCSRAARTSVGTQV